MKYPKLPEELDKRRRLNSIQIEEIKKLYKEGWSQYKLAAEFKVSRTIIRYHLVDPETRKEINQKRYASLVEQKVNDPEFAKKHRQQTIKSYIEGYKKLEARREYKGKNTYKWKKKRYRTNTEFREKTKAQSREPSRLRSKEKWDTDSKYREYQNEKNKQNYIKRLLNF